MATAPNPTSALVGQKLTAAFWNTEVATAITFLAQTPICVLRSSTVQNLTTGVFTDLTFDIEEVDTDGGHSTVTNPNRYTAQTAGWYDVRGSVLWGANATGLRLLRFVVNNTTPYRVADAPAAASGSASTGGASLIFLNVGDYVTMQGRQDSTVTLATQISDQCPRFEIRWVSK
jgi:hypothetical protein